MISIKKQYIVDENQAPVAVQMDIKTFNKIERLLEEFVLVAKIKENKPKDRLQVNEAKAYYASLKKPSI